MQPLHQLLDMGDGGETVDAVAEVQDVGPAGHGFEARFERPVQRGAAGLQRQRIDVALQGQRIRLLATMKPRSVDSSMASALTAVSRA